ncbi:putative copper resistance protein D [Klenkia marina]|uniref:Putative copper resistance protein D n=1 Tax=Klenkia marina TaxID=1960309 RepID=A0A1G4Z4Y0_9ACTN|nr:putative copper resistance protein D [Klenkia marina]
MVVTVAAALGVGVAVALLATSGSLAPVALPGLPTASAAVTGAIPAVKVLSDLAAVATAGCLLAAALLAPGHQRMSVAGHRWTRLAAWPGAIWSLSAAILAPLQLADFLGTDLQSVSGRGLWSFVTTIPQGQAQAMVVVLTAAVVIGARRVLTTGGSLALLLVALLASLPPVFTGHAAGSGSHQAAVSGLALHIVGVLAWAGGVLALLLIRRVPPGVLAAASTRFSTAAPVLVGLVAVSGMLTASTRMSHLSDLIDTDYGRQVLAKTAALILLGVMGWAHRRRTLPALAAGNPTAFRRLAAGEVLAFATTIGIAVSLSRTPTPRPTDRPGQEEGSTFDTLGFALPPDPVGGRWWTQLWEPYPDPLFPLLTAVGVAAYLWAVRAQTHRGGPWPARRTACLVGWAAVMVLATTSGLARYAQVWMPAHMLQYLLLALLGSALLVLARPGKLLAQQYCAPAGARPDSGRDDRGPAEWVQAFSSSRVTQLLRRPGPALAVFAVVVYLGATGPVLELTLRSHAAHVVSVLATSAAGALLVRSWFDSKLSRAIRVRWILIWAALHAVASTALLLWPDVLAPTWWAEIDPTWRGPALDDQRTAAVLALLLGITAAVLAIGRVWRAGPHRSAEPAGPRPEPGRLEDVDPTIETKP